MTETTPLPPADLLYAAVQMTRPLLRNITARVEANLAGTGISVGQRAILEGLLDRDRATAPEITAALQVTRQFVGREIKTLSEDGLVDAQPNPNRRGASIYALTPRSRQIITQIRAREAQQFAAFAARFTPAEIAAYHAVQSALYAAFAETAPDGSPLVTMS